MGMATADKLQAAVLPLLCPVDFVWDAVSGHGTEKTSIGIL